MNNILPDENKRILLSELLTDSVVDSVQASKDESNYVYKESTIVEDIVENTPTFDIGKNLSSASREVLKTSENIARSFYRDTIFAADLFNALIKDEQVRNKLEKFEINIDNLEEAINNRTEKGNLEDSVLRKKDTVLSKDVEFVIKNSLKFSASERSPFIEPQHILVTLLKKGHPVIGEIMDDLGSSTSILVRNLENENN